MDKEALEQKITKVEEEITKVTSQIDTYLASLPTAQDKEFVKSEITRLGKKKEQLRKEEEEAGL